MGCDIFDKDSGIVDAGRWVFVKSIADELDRVARWFSSGGTYCNATGNICSISGPIINSSSTVTWRHMSGDVNPKTCAKFTADERRKIEATQPHNLLQNLAARRDNINGLSLPSGREIVSSCRVEELKAMVIVRGGDVTGRNDKALQREELQKVVRAYLSMEAKNTRSTVYFNQHCDDNGIFVDVDTS